jgi:hypothetical protein
MFTDSTSVAIPSGKSLLSSKVVAATGSVRISICTSSVETQPEFSP